MDAGSSGPQGTFSGLLSSKLAMRHECYRNGWATCTVCDGRQHDKGCTSRLRPAVDCCQARHAKLASEGQTVGLFDRSRPMHDLADPTWGTR